MLINHRVNAHIYELTSLTSSMLTSFSDAVAPQSSFRSVSEIPWHGDRANKMSSSSSSLMAFSMDTNIEASSWRSWYVSRSQRLRLSE